MDKFLQINKKVRYLQYSDFCEVREIGSGGYGTVCTAKYKDYQPAVYVVLKRFKDFDGMPELFINEVSNNC